MSERHGIGGDPAEALRLAGIPCTGDELYTGEFRVGRREQAPYYWTLLVPEEKADEALKVLGTNNAGVHALELDAAPRARRWAESRSTYKMDRDA